MTRICQHCKRELPIEDFPRVERGGDRKHAVPNDVERHYYCRTCWQQGREKMAERLLQMDAREAGNVVPKKHGPGYVHHAPKRKEIEAAEEFGRTNYIPTMAQLRRCSRFDKIYEEYMDKTAGPIAPGWSIKRNAKQG